MLLKLPSKGEGTIKRTFGNEFLPIRGTYKGENENFSIDVTMHFVGWNSHFTWGTM